MMAHFAPAFLGLAFRRVILRLSAAASLALRVSAVFCLAFCFVVAMFFNMLIRALYHKTLLAGKNALWHTHPLGVSVLL
jgi:hypothetical protein